MFKVLTVITAAAVCCLVNIAARAEQPFSESLSPGITVGFQFGHAERADRPVHFTAAFNVQSRQFQVEGAAASATQSAMPLTVSQNVTLLNVFEFGADGDSLDSAQVFGHDLLESGGN